MTEMHRLGIRKPDHRCGMKARADDEALREMLVGRRSPVRSDGR